MKNCILLALVFLFCDVQASDVRGVMASCGSEANEKNLSGDSRKAFMSECLKSGLDQINAETEEFQTTLTAKRGATPAQIESIRKAMLYILKDSDSAKFSNVTVRAEKSAPTVVRVCGMVNAKNSMGAYAGFAQFTGLLGKKTVVEAVDNDSTSDALHTCAKWGM